MLKQLVTKTLSKKWVFAGMAILGLGVTQASLAKNPSLVFDEVFNVKDEPNQTYFVAVFKIADNQTHILQVWRDGENRLRRQTDNRLDVLATRDVQDTDAYSLQVIDYQKRIITDINRNNLIYLGHFQDWFELGHGLHHPKAQYRLMPTTRPQLSPQPIQACEWYQLEQANQEYDICWSAQEKLPLMIWDNQKKTTVWQIKTLSHQMLERDIFKVNTTDYVRVDANDDIQND